MLNVQVSMKSIVMKWSISLVSEEKKKVTVLVSVTRSDAVENRHAWTSFLSYCAPVQTPDADTYSNL